MNFGEQLQKKIEAEIDAMVWGDPTVSSAQCVLDLTSAWVIVHRELRITSNPRPVRQREPDYTVSTELPPDFVEVETVPQRRKTKAAPLNVSRRPG